MAVRLLSKAPTWHEIMDCSLSLGVGVALSDGAINENEKSIIRDFFTPLCNDSKYLGTVAEGIEAYTKHNRHPSGVCKYMAVACADQQKVALLTALIRIAECDGPLAPMETWFIERSAFVMEVPDADVPDLRSLANSPDPSEYLGERLAHNCSVLGVMPPVDLASLKRAYRAAAMKNHPDTAASGGRISAEEAHRRFIEVREAYEVLLAAIEAGALGGAPTTTARVELDTLGGAALTFWSGFPKATWTTKPKTIEQLWAEKEEREAQSKAHAVKGHGVADTPEARQQGGGSKTRTASTEKSAASPGAPQPAPQTETARASTRGEVGAPLNWTRALTALAVTLVIANAVAGLIFTIQAYGTETGTFLALRPAFSLLYVLYVLVSALSAYCAVRAGRGRSMIPWTDVATVQSRGTPEEHGAHPRDAVSVSWSLMPFLESLTPFLVTVGTMEVLDSIGRKVIQAAVYDVGERSTRTFIMIAVYTGVASASALAGLLAAGWGSPQGGRLCRSCSATLEDGGGFCPKCGQNLTPTCSKCRAILPEGAAFCSKCGAAVKR